MKRRPLPDGTAERSTGWVRHAALEPVDLRSLQQTTVVLEASPTQAKTGPSWGWTATRLLGSLSNDGRKPTPPRSAW